MYGFVDYLEPRDTTCINNQYSVSPLISNHPKSIPTSHFRGENDAFLLSDQ